MSEDATGANSAARPARVRVDEIDVWRGLAIVLVVCGHAVQFTTADFDANWVFRAIYSFHMPLFFFISGLVGAAALTRPLATQLKSRFLGLVVPFLAWYTIVQTGYWALSRGPSLLQSFQALFFFPDNGLWFLWVLFLVTMVAALLVRVPRVSRVITLLVASVVFQLIHVDVLGLGLFKWYFPFFAVGVLLSQQVEAGSWRRLRTLWVAVPAVAAYAVFVYGWTRVGLVPLALAWQAHGLPLARAIDLLYRYGAASSGIVASLSIVVFIPVSSKVAAAFKYLGKRTLEIYVSHQLFLIPFASVGVIWAPVAAVFAGGASLLTANILKRVKVLRVLLYGGRA